MLRQDEWTEYTRAWLSAERQAVLCSCWGLDRCDVGTQQQDETPQDDEVVELPRSLTSGTFAPSALQT